MKKGLSKIAMALFAAGLAFNVSAADIKVAVASDATSLDPQEQLSGQTLEMSHLVFDPLMRYTQDLKFEPRLAEKYERIDDKTVRFHLRKGVKFHSGNPLRPEDVIYSFKRVLALNKAPAFILTQLGWTPKITLPQLVSEMVQSDYRMARRDAMVKLAGFPAFEFHE